MGPRLLIIDPSDDYESPEISLDVALQEALTLTDHDPFTWRIVPDFDKDYDYIFRFALAIENVTVIAEEVSDYSGNEHFRRLLRRGRSKGIRVISVAQRPAEVHKTICSQSALIIAFYTDEPRDLIYIQDRFGTQAMDEVKSLKKDDYECSVWGDLKIWDHDFDTYAPYPTLKPIERKAGDTHGSDSESAVSG